MKYIKINPADNVAVAIEPLQKDEQVVIDGRAICLADDVPAGHKFLLNDLAQGENVVKYGYPIGHLMEDHHAGECINHTHIKTNLSGLLDYTYDPIQIAEDEFASRPQEHFMGYRRKNGDVGIRNEIWIVPTVGCVNGVCLQLRDRLRDEVKDLRIVAFPHNYGCSQLSGDHENTRKILRDLVLHPNAGGVLVVGLGCENNQPSQFEDFLGDYDKERIRFMVSHDVEGDDLVAGMRI